VLHAIPRGRHADHDQRRDRQRQLKPLAQLVG
jgi:hypothetical protein